MLSSLLTHLSHCPHPMWSKWLDYLFSVDGDLLERLKRYKNTINHLTFSCDTFIFGTHIDCSTNVDQFIIKSSIDDTLAFGVSTTAPVQLTDIKQQNQKRLKQLNTEWGTLNDTITNDLYESKTSKNEQKRNVSKVSEMRLGHFVSSLRIMISDGLSFQMRELEARIRKISRLQFRCWTSHKDFLGRNRSIACMYSA